MEPAEDMDPTFGWQQESSRRLRPENVPPAVQALLDEARTQVSTHFSH